MAARGLRKTIKGLRIFAFEKSFSLNLQGGCNELSGRLNGGMDSGGEDFENAGVLAVRPVAAAGAGGGWGEVTCGVEAGEAQGSGDWLEEVLELISGEGAVGSGGDAFSALALPWAAVEAAEVADSASGVLAGRLGLVGAGHGRGVTRAPGIQRSRF